MEKSGKLKPDDYFELSSDTGKVLLRPLKSLTIHKGFLYDRFISNFKYLEGANNLTIDFTKVKKYDSYLVVFILAIKNHCESNNILFKLTGMNSEMERFLTALTPKSEIQTDKKIFSFWYNYISHIGEITSTILTDARLFIEFLGDVIIKMLAIFIHPRKIRWKDFPSHFMSAGVHAVPITFLIVFLIGLISGYQGALQLSQVGADMFIADLIGISITRELAPLMTAILVAGRSGSAFAAEIGTMKVSEEIDALNSMGFDHINFLVLPRILAVMLAMPILILLTDIAGIVGGLVAALATLDVTIAGYVNQLHRAIDFSDVFSGVGKGIIFGFLIAAVGCFRGLQVHGGAEGVGKYTTASVVSGILLIIIFDALFTYIFQMLGV